ncbi:Clavaminate synthase-like protein [Dacryopinax primogenitus]|uniref:Clavaminate synthase-like protein n=1 Tax=Dacryopinax primogenitus (strain DJM 731) TaxID=1858805 RepID=M5G5K9_DACPD|nr:Clavaminate synthase-like protein [Dacryopinax primogenitus]EJU03505.1 Clavaminate synthase-like protein [Dacryopinax primogenitus]
MGDVAAEPLASFQGLPPFPDNIPTAPLVTLSLAKLQANDPQEVAEFFKIGKGLGFFYLDLRGCDNGRQLLHDAEALLELQKQYFDLPLEEKRISDRETVPGSDGFFGWKALGTLAVDKTGKTDRNEQLTVKKDDIVGNTAPLPVPELIRNNMPLLKSFATNAFDIVQVMLTHLNDQLELAPGTLPNMHRLYEESGDHVRMLKAPPAPGEPSLSAGPHTDFGSLTVLFNWLGGLQVVLPGASKEWVYVRPVPGCAIVNLGDALVKFTAGLLRSNIHRVMSPPGNQASLVRYSLVYFSRPENAVVLKQIKGGLIDNQPISEEPQEEFTAKQWFLRRAHLNKKNDNWKPENWAKSRAPAPRSELATEPVRRKSAEPEVNSAMRSLFRRTAQPVAILTSRHAPSSSTPTSSQTPAANLEEYYHGATLSSFTSISLSPLPLVAFSLHLPSRAAQAIQHALTSGIYPCPSVVVNILSASQAAIGRHFSRPDLWPNPWEMHNHDLTEEGIPLFPDSLGAVSCAPLTGFGLDRDGLKRMGINVPQGMTYDSEETTSEIFIAQVIRVELENTPGTLPLLYHERVFKTIAEDIVEGDLKLPPPVPRERAKA